MNTELLPLCCKKCLNAHKHKSELPCRVCAWKNGKPTKFEAKK